MTRLYFVVPIHGRQELSRVCLRQLARTCEAVEEYGIDATAVVIGDKDELGTARELGFATVERDNKQLGRKFNDGYQLACDPEHNPQPADYVVPCGSDDWVDPVIFQRLPPRGTLGVFRQLAVVNEERTRIARLRVTFQGGAGVRIIPADLIARTGYRPAAEELKRGCDNSALAGIRDSLDRRLPPMVDLDVHPLQIVDWKSPVTQLNSYRAIARRATESEDVWAELAEHYPSESLSEMAALHVGDMIRAGATVTETVYA